MENLLFVETGNKVMATAYYAKLSVDVDHLLGRLSPKTPSRFTVPVLELLLSKCKVTRACKVAERDTGTSYMEDLRSMYENEKLYEVMNVDKHRNRVFVDMFERQIRGRHLKRWVEIGPGASGTLTKMILDMAPDTRVDTLEAVSNSVKQLKATLGRHRPYLKRFTVQNTLVGLKKLDIPRDIQAVAGEVLGHVASVEGWVPILHGLSRYNPELKKVGTVVPLLFGTKMVPVNLEKWATRAREKGSHVVVGSTVALVERIPFTQVQISDKHGIMEHFDSLQELRTGAHQPIRTFVAEFHVKESQPFHGLGLYMYLGDGHSSTTSDKSRGLSFASSNWDNVFVPVGKGAWRVEDGDVIRVVSKCKVEQFHPSYELDIHVFQGARSKVKYNESVTFDYYDVIGMLLYPVDELLKTLSSAETKSRVKKEKVISQL